VDNEELAKWRSLQRVLITESSDPLIKGLLKAARDRKVIEIIYYGGSCPGARRKILPRYLFQLPGNPHIYLKAFCYKRGEERTFRADKIALAEITEPQEISLNRKLGCFTGILVLIFLFILYRSYPQRGKDDSGE